MLYTPSTDVGTNVATHTPSSSSHRPRKEDWGRESFLSLSGAIEEIRRRVIPFLRPPPHHPRYKRNNFLILLEGRFRRMLLLCRHFHGNHTRMMEKEKCPLLLCGNQGETKYCTQSKEESPYPACFLRSKRQGEWRQSSSFFFVVFCDQGGGSFSVLTGRWSSLFAIPLIEKVKQGQSRRRVAHLLFCVPLLFCCCSPPQSL